MKDTTSTKSQLIQGIIEKAEIVGSTYGPNGKLVLIDDPTGVPYFTQDGYTVLDAMSKRDKTLASKLLTDAAKMVARQAGDGTTTCALLIQGALKHNINLSDHLSKFTEILNNYSNSPKREHVINSAITAAKNEEIGTEIGNLVWELGPDGHIRAKPGIRFRAFSRPGYEMEGGPLLPQFLQATGSGIFNHVDSLTLTSPLVVIINHTLTDQRQLSSIYRQWDRHKEGDVYPPLVIVAGDVDEKPLQNVAMNLLKNHHPVFIVQPPPIKDLKLRRAILEDLRYVCDCDKIYEKSSGSVIDRTGKGFSGHFGAVEAIDLEDGLARFIGDPDRVVDRKEQVRKEKIDDDQKNLRLSLLSGASGVIEIGAGTTAEAHNMNLAIEDAVRASQGVLKTGYVKGGPELWEGIAREIPELYEMLETMWERLPAGGESIDSADAILKAFTSAASLVDQINKMEYAIS